MNNINYSDSQSMNNIGNISTEYSNTSDNFKSLIQQATNGKQFMNDYDNLALEAAKDGELSVLSYLIRKNKIYNFSIQDKKNGFTILHYIIYNYNKIPNSEQLIDKILNSQYVNNFINIQDFVGKNTPLHIAVSLGLDDVADKLILKGADRTVRNNSNEYVCTDNENDYYSAASNASNQKNNSQDSVFISKNSLEDTIKNIANWFFKGNNNNTSEASLRMTDAFNNNNNNNTFSQNLSSTSPAISNTDQYVQQLINQQTDSPTSNSNNNTTDQIINEVMQNQNNQDIFSQTSENTNNSDFVNKIIEKQKKIKQVNLQKGGYKKQQILGNRKMKTISDFEMMGGQTDSHSSIDPINDRDNQFKRIVGAMDTSTGWEDNGRNDKQILGNQGLVSVQNSSGLSKSSGSQTVGDIGNTSFKNRGSKDFRTQSRYNFDNDNQSVQAQRSRKEENEDYGFGRQSIADTATSDNNDYQDFSRDNTATSDNNNDKIFSRGSTEISNYDAYRTQNRAVNDDKFNNKMRKMSRNNSDNSDEPRFKMDRYDAYNRSQSRESNENSRDELSRLIQNQADVIHKRTIEKIKDLLGVDEEKAKIYKAALYNKVKTEHPELNNYDRAVEMEKITTTENLKQINFEEWDERIKKGREDKKTNIKNSDKSDKKSNKSKNKKPKVESEVSESSILSVTNDSSIHSLSSNNL